MKYRIWDKETQVITPNGKIFTAEEWIAKYPIAALDNVDVVCGGGLFNGAIFGVYEDMKERYAKMGCDFDGCETKQDCLNKMEEFEDEQNNTTIITDQTRIADALEDLVVLNMPDEEVE